MTKNAKMTFENIKFRFVYVVEMQPKIMKWKLLKQHYPKTAANVFKQLCRCMKWSGSFHGLLNEWKTKQNFFFIISYQQAKLYFYIKLDFSHLPLSRSLYPLRCVTLIGAFRVTCDTRKFIRMSSQFDDCWTVFNSNNGNQFVYT